MYGQTYVSALTRKYDPLGRSSGFTLTTDATTNMDIKYTYTPQGQFHSISSSVSSVSSVVNYSYLPNSTLIASKTTSVSSAPSVVTTYTYEPHRNLITSIQNTAGTNTISTFAYQNDPLGRRTQRLDNNSTTNIFDYNTKSELIYATMNTNSYTYNYDQIGNRVRATRMSPSQSTTNLYWTNPLNQYTNISTAGATSLLPTYDPDGNLLVLHSLGDGGTNTWTLTYNAENRLVKTESLPSVPDEFKVCVENEYDYMGRRFRKTVKDDYSGGTYTTTNVTTFIYNGWELIAEMCDVGCTNYYCYGIDSSGTLGGAAGCGGLLSKTTVTASDTNTYFYLSDGNANVVGMVDEAGSVVASYEYSPFGVCIKATGSQASSNAFRYSTHYFDVETGLYNAKNRYYHPETGRFLSNDPIEEQGGPHRYAYVQNEPIGSIDPYGLWKITRGSSFDWAVALAEKGDTFQTLADNIRLNYSERTKWLKAGGDAFVKESDKAKEGCRYAIPNVMAVYTSKSGIGDGVITFVTQLKRLAEWNGRRYEAKGYKVVRKLWHASESDFIDLWGLDGIFSIAFAGHGNKYGFVADKDSGLAVNPGEVSPPYKLQAIRAYSCLSANEIIGNEMRPDGTWVTHKWKDHLSDKGTFIGYSGWANWISWTWNEENDNIGDIPD
jgi:RHS repeat-associated protein